MQGLNERIKEYESALDLARDQAIDRTEKYTRFNSAHSVLIHQEVLRSKNGIDTVNCQMSRVSVNLESLTSDSNYMRKRLEEAGVQRRDDREQDTKRHAEIQESLSDFCGIMMTGIQELKRVVEIDAENRRQEAEKKKLEDDKANTQLINRDMILKMLLELQRGM